MDRFLNALPLLPITLAIGWCWYLYPPSGMLNVSGQRGKDKIMESLGWIAVGIFAFLITIPVARKWRKEGMEKK